MFCILIRCETKLFVSGRLKFETLVSAKDKVNQCVEWRAVACIFKVRQLLCVLCNADDNWFIVRASVLIGYSVVVLHCRNWLSVYNITR